MLTLHYDKCQLFPIGLRIDSPAFKRIKENVTTLLRDKNLTNDELAICKYIYDQIKLRERGKFEVAIDERSKNRIVNSLAHLCALYQKSFDCQQEKRAQCIAEIKELLEKQTYSGKLPRGEFIRLAIRLYEENRHHFSIKISCEIEDRGYRYLIGKFFQDGTTVYLKNRDFIVEDLKETVDAFCRTFGQDVCTSQDLTQREECLKVFIPYLAGISFGLSDLNLLKAVNEYGKERHASGDKLIISFVDVMENGRCKSFLEKVGIRARFYSLTGGDEFIQRLDAPFDIRPILPLIDNMRNKELIDVPGVEDLVDFKNTEVAEYLCAWEVDDPGDEKFVITSSIGWKTLIDALGEVDIRGCKSYEEAIHSLINKIYLDADRESQRNKEEIKVALKDSHPALAALSRMRDGTRRIKRLRAERDEAREKVVRLEEENRRLREQRTENSENPKHQITNLNSI